MAVIAKFKITKGAESGILVMSMTTIQSWYLESPVSWFPASGTYAQIRNATKFRQWYVTRLMDTGGDWIAEWPSPPYRLGDKHTGELMTGGWFRHDSGQYFDIEVAQGAGTKKFQIREKTDMSISYGVGQLEVALFEIRVPSGNPAVYTYRGMGLGVSLPVPKIPMGGGKFIQPSVPGSLSTAGPWNDFDAPSFMSETEFEGDATIQTPYNVGLSTGSSYNVLDVHASPDGFAVDVHITGFSTGNTFSLPSFGFTSGRMELFKPSPRSCGKSICW